MAIFLPVSPKRWYYKSAPPSQPQACFVKGIHPIARASAFVYPVTLRLVPLLMPSPWKLGFILPGFLFFSDGSLCGLSWLKLRPPAHPSRALGLQVHAATPSTRLQHMDVGVHSRKTWSSSIHELGLKLSLARQWWWW